MEEIITGYSTGVKSGSVNMLGFIPQAPIFPIERHKRLQQLQSARASEDWVRLMKNSERKTVETN